jgi:hypothetical protein
LDTANNVDGQLFLMDFILMGKDNRLTFLLASTSQAGKVIWQQNQFVPDLKCPPF